VSGIYVCGIGAVSPAGWGADKLSDAVEKGSKFPGEPVKVDGVQTTGIAARVPAPPSRPAFLAHPRLRRSSPISQFAVAAALEALGQQTGTQNTAVILCVMSGSVNYSRRFYAETLRDPATASPLVFPETVFNAPSSHISAVLNSNAPNYTLVGDAGMYLVGLALGAQWLQEELVDGVLVIASEEMDILTTTAVSLFERRALVSEGSGALYLRREPTGAVVELEAITQPISFVGRAEREPALLEVRDSILNGSTRSLLVESRSDDSQWNRLETEVWRDWSGPRLAVKNVLGEALSASSAWQCVCAVEQLRRRPELQRATVSVLGLNQQAIAARFAVHHE